MTPSTALYEWCHVMYSAISEDINDLYILWLIEKHLNFYIQQVSFLYQYRVISSMLTCFARGKICIFTMVQYVKIWTHIVFFFIMCQEVSSWILQHWSSLSAYFLKVICFQPFNDVITTILTQPIIWLDGKCSCNGK